MKRRASPKALGRTVRKVERGERERVLDVLASPRFVDRAPAEVVATLLDEGRYLCSQRTMYRVLAANQVEGVGRTGGSTLSGHRPRARDRRDGLWHR